MAHITVWMTSTEYAYQYRPDHEFAQDPLIVGVHFDPHAKQPSTTAFNIPVNSEKILHLPSTEFVKMLEEPHRLDHYCSLINERGRVHVYQGQRVTVKVPLTPLLNGALVVSRKLEEGRRSMFDAPFFVPYENIEEIKFLRPELPSEPTNKLEDVANLLSSFAPDADRYADGTPKDRARYPPQISGPIPTSRPWPDVAADAYLASLPKPMETTNLLVALDPAVAAGFLLTMDLTNIDVAVNSMTQTANSFFKIYEDQERLTSTRLPWWKEALKVMANGYTSLGTVAKLTRSMGSQEYEVMRQPVYTLRNHLGIMFRRTGKEPMDPANHKTDSPAWWWKDHKEWKKLRTKTQDEEKQEITSENQGARRKRIRRPRFNKGNSRLHNRGGKSEEDQADEEQEPEVPEGAPPGKTAKGANTKKVKPSKVQGPRHTRCQLNKKTGEWWFY